MIMAQVESMSPDLGKRKLKVIDYLYYSIFCVFILRVLLFFITDRWDYYPTHNDFDVTDFGLSILAGHFEPHWYGYGYLTFLYSALSTLVGFLWHIISSGWMSLHNYLVYLILEPREILLFNRIGFYVALCMSVLCVGYYIRKKTNDYYALFFIAGIILTNSFYSIKHLIKSQAIEPLWVILSLMMAEKLYESVNRKYLMIAGCVLGLAWSTAFTGLILAGIFFITFFIYQLTSYIQKKSTFRELIINHVWIFGSFIIAYIITSPYCLINFGEWSANTINLVKEGEVGGFTWDRLPSLQKTLDYIGYNTIFPGLVVVILFFSFVFDEIRVKSLRYVHGILFALVCLYLYSRSPHVKDYYLYNFTMVMTIFSLIFIYRLAEIFPRLKYIVPIILFSIVLYTNSNTKVLSGFFSPPDFSRSNGYENDNLLKVKEWISDSLSNECLFIFDGWLHFLPPITCTDSILTSNLWGHYRYGREHNTTIQELTNQARRIKIERGDKVYPAVRLWFDYEYNRERIKKIQEIIKKQNDRPVYYMVSSIWCDQYLGKGMNLKENQKPFIEYYTNFISGKFGPLLFKEKGIFIIKLDKEKYLLL